MAQFPVERRRSTSVDMRAVPRDEAGPPHPDDYVITYAAVEGVHPTLPPEMAEEKRRVYKLVESNPAAAIPILTEWVARFPDVPIIKDWLLLCHRKLGEHGAADEVGRLMLAAHPDYLFTRLYWAERLLDVGRYDEFPTAIGPSFDLMRMYPHRKVFHVIEAISLWAVLARYRALIGDFDGAFGHLDDMRRIAPNDPVTLQIARLIAYEKGVDDRRAAEEAGKRAPRVFRQGSHSPKKERNRKGRRR